MSSVSGIHARAFVALGTVTLGSVIHVPIYYSTSQVSTQDFPCTVARTPFVNKVHPVATLSVLLYQLVCGIQLRTFALTFILFIQMQIPCQSTELWARLISACGSEGYYECLYSDRSITYTAITALHTLMRDVQLEAACIHFCLIRVSSSDASSVPWCPIYVSKSPELRAGWNVMKSMHT